MGFVTDSARGTWASLLALAVAVPIAEVWLRVGLDAGDDAPRFVPYYLVFWPTFSVVYLVWTHLVYARRGTGGLGPAVRRESESRARWWNRWLGSEDASTLTIGAAVLAVVVTVSVAQSPQFQDSSVTVALGLATVASSWALMVYGFATEYLLLDQRLRESGEPRMTFHAEGDPEFGDYLTFALLASTMAATISADVGSRAVWRKVRANVLLAFAFNSVVVAMMVSLLFGGLAA